MNSKVRRALRRARVRNPHQGNEGSTGRIMTVQPYLLGNQVNVGKIPLFPPRYKGTLRYADTITLSSAAGVVASWVFACNGLYDPDITGTGHQPAGFDQMMLSYEHYTVIRARITATFHNNTSNATPTVAISVNAGATPVTVINQIMEDGLVTTSRLLPAGANGCVQTIQRSCNVAVFGGVPRLLDDSSYRGTVSSNPTELSYFHLQLWNTEGATSSSAVDLVIEYESWFTEPRKLTESLSAPVRDEVMKDLVSRERRDLSPLRESHFPANFSELVRMAISDDEKHERKK